MPGMSTYGAMTRRWTRIEYEKLIDLGIFRPGEAIDLLGGELIVSEPQGALHYTAILKTARALEAVFGAGWVVRTQGPYARAGLADSWIVNLIDRVLDVYREPAADPSSPFGWRYTRREVLRPSAEVRPLAMPSAAIRVADLLP